MAMNNRFTDADAAREENMVSLGIVIPTLNNSMTILKVLESLDFTSVGYRRDVLIVDGGSTDETVNIVKNWDGKARVITAPPGRGSQLRHGIDEVEGDWLLLLHPDAELSPRWLEEALKFMRDPAKFTTAGHFELEIQSDNSIAKWLTNWANFRAKNFGLPYGDQGLIISRVLYKKVGQLRDIPIMEDVDLASRIGPKALQHLHAKTRVSPDRYRQGGGWVKRTFLNGFAVMLFKLGFEIDFIKSVYGKLPAELAAANGGGGASAPPPTPAADDVAVTKPTEAEEAEAPAEPTDADKVAAALAAQAEARSQGEEDTLAPEDVAEEVSAETPEEEAAEAQTPPPPPPAEPANDVVTDEAEEDDTAETASDDTSEDDKKEEATASKS
ncbi:MAG: hypothetical protein Alpg2KO_27470 [Alphaproteobacteria bacterium]